MRYLNVHLISDTAPPAPRCFDSEEAWRDWLVAAHCSGERIVRRVDVGRKRDQRITYFATMPAERIDYCQDCTPSRRLCMLRAGRCSPSAAAIDAGAVPVVELRPLLEAA